jgi:DNA-directed RNA polymerase subunit RPC12/RpoP
MKYQCHECGKYFIEEAKKGWGVNTGTVCPYCKMPICIPITIHEEEKKI